MNATGSQENTVMLASNVTAGLANFRGELIAELASRYKVVVLADDNGKGGELENLGAQVVQMAMSRHGLNPFRELQSLAFYKKQMRAFHPRILLTYTIKPNIYAGMAAASLGIPCVANITGLGEVFGNPGLLPWLVLPLYRHGLRKAQRVFFQNPAHMDFLRRHSVVREDQCMLLPGSGVNLRRFVPQPYPSSPVCEFLFVARVTKMKGIEEYLAAARNIRRDCPNTVFHVCGRCEQQYEQLLSKLQAEGTIVYHGRVENMLPLYARSACVVLPSYSEGMSNVLLEASACARPVVTTDQPGCRDVVDVGVNGFLAKARDAEDLTEKLRAFLALPAERRKTMGLAGRTKVEREFDRNIVIQRYLSEIEKVLH